MFFINPFIYGAGADFESIATVTVGSGGASNVEFTSIPSTYQHLQIRFIARSNRSTYSSDTLLMRVNGVTTSTYAGHLLGGDGGSAFVFDISSSSRAVIGSLSTTAATSSSFAGGVIDILDYSSTSKATTARALSGQDNNSGSTNQLGYITLNSGLWTGTDAVTSILLYPENGTTLQQHSTFALYGIKAP